MHPLRTDKHVMYVNRTYHSHTHSGSDDFELFSFLHYRISSTFLSASTSKRRFVDVFSTILPTPAAFIA